MIPFERPGESESPIDLAMRVAAAASRTRGVVRLSGGLLGGAATYATGRRVEGVRVRDDRVEVHVIAAGSVDSLPALADEVRRTVASVDPRRRVDVFIEDIDPEVLDLDAVDLVAGRSS